MNRLSNITSPRKDNIGIWGYSLSMLPAEGCATLGGMAELKRGQDEIARKNLVYVIEACNRRLGSATGGVRYLARLLGTNETYVSQVASGYKGRNPGRKLKGKIESIFRLDPDWMDAYHDESVVSELLPLVPSLPYQRNTGTRASQSDVVELQGKLDEALRRLSELESRLASKSTRRR